MKSFLQLLILLAPLFYAACTSTITPRVVSDTTASWDGNTQNSGFIGFDEAGNGIITMHAKDRYNTLIDRYGSRFHPPLMPDAGVNPGTNGTCLIDAQHLSYFMRMQRWEKTLPPDHPLRAHWSDP